jgi:hypothetical protein
VVTSPGLPGGTEENHESSQPVWPVSRRDSKRAPSKHKNGALPLHIELRVFKREVEH